MPKVSNYTVLYSPIQTPTDTYILTTTTMGIYIVAGLNHIDSYRPIQSYLRTILSYYYYLSKYYKYSCGIL